MADQPKLPLKVPASVLAGVYANQMMVRHTREEFVLDFVNRFPPRAVVTARVIVSPGHCKRLIKALSQNLQHYVSTHGAIRSGKQPAAPTAAAPAGPATAPTAPTGGTSVPGGQTGQAAGAVATDPSKSGKPRELFTLPETVAPGVYANQMVVSHSADEFLLDFINVFAPGDAIVTSRVFVSPSQIGRMIRGMKENLQRYENAFGTVIEATAPQPDSYLN